MVGMRVDILLMVPRSRIEKIEREQADRPVHCAEKLPRDKKSDKAGTGMVDNISIAPGKLFVQQERGGAAAVQGRQGIMLNTKRIRFSVNTRLSSIAIGTGRLRCRRG